MLALLAALAAVHIAAATDDKDKPVAKPVADPAWQALFDGKTLDGWKVADFQEKMNRPEIKTEYKRRGQLVEFPIAWIKEKMKFRRFHVRGRAKAGLEMLWVGLAYNLIQWIRYTRTPAVNG